MYMAAKGMMVVAVDPLKPNMDRLRESLCLNGIEVCRMFGVSRANWKHVRELGRASA
jgi:hypothetical protein